jgi:hypothetical protein
VSWRSHTPDLIHPRPQRLTYSTNKRFGATIRLFASTCRAIPTLYGVLPGIRTLNLLICYVESCPRFEYLFLTTYSLLPTTIPFLGPAVYAPKRRTNLSLAGPTPISPPSVSPVPAFRPAIRRLPLGMYTYFYLRHCPSYNRKTNPQRFLSHWQALHITQRDLWPIGVIAIWPLQKTLPSTTTPAPSWFDLLLLFRLYRCKYSSNAFASHEATAHITNRQLSYIIV